MSSVENIPKMDEKKKGKVGITDTNLLLIITIGVFFVMYIGAILSGVGSFNKPQYFLDILIENTGLIIAACGMSLVMICGGIDISISGVMCFVCMFDAIFIDTWGHDIVVKILGENAGAFTINITILILSIVVAILIGALFGAFQGWLVAYLNIQPFIISLAGLFLAKGLTTIVSPEPHRVENELFKEWTLYKVDIPFLGSPNKNGDWVPASISVGVIVAIVIVILMFAMLKWTKFGRNFYAVGGNRQSALMLGINVRKTIFSSHLLCGILASIGGYTYFLMRGSGDPAHAAGLEMEAIASSIIGGTLLTGGVGNIIGTFFGVATLKTITKIVFAAGFNEPYWTQITVGAMLSIFLVVQSIIMAVRNRK